MTNRESGLYGRSRNVTTRRIIRLGLGFGQVVRETHSDLNHINPSQNSEDGLYVISVAARMLDMHPQTLRKYERAGLVQPSRTVGMLRLYSEEDINNFADVVLVNYYGSVNNLSSLLSRFVISIWSSVMITYFVSFSSLKIAHTACCYKHLFL